MKTWMVAASLVLGAAGGVGLTWAEFHGVTIDFITPHMAPATLPELAEQGEAPQGPLPKAVVFETEYKFGTMVNGTEQSHSFTIANDGEADLMLSLISVSCKCTLGNLSNGEDQIVVKPGEETKVTLTWKGAGKTGGPFRQWAEISTNDPRQRMIKLWVKGEITESVHVHPTDLVFSGLSPKEPRTASVTIMCQLDKPMEIKSITFEDADLEKYFLVVPTKLSPEELVAPGSKSGFRLDVTVKPGLPLGPFEQTISLLTNLSEHEKLKIPVVGAVVSEVSIFGKGWESSLGILRLGTVASSEGAERTLQVLFRGAKKEEFTVEIEKATPEILHASLGAAETSGTSVKVPLLLSIAKGSPPANHTGTRAAPDGEIILKTNHPSAARVRILVRFVVE